LSNEELRKMGGVEIALEILFLGQKYRITADRVQILDLLLSSYESAVQKNMELAKAQEELRLSSGQLEASNKELEAFSYSVSHDLRAPLRAIDGFSAILLKNSYEKLDERDRHYLDVIRSSTKKMGELIDDLLAFSRLGAQEIRFTQIQMDQLARTVFEDLRLSVPDRKLELKMGNLPPTRADIATMRQVLFNLLSNAVKFTRSCPEAVIEIDSRIEKNEVIYFIRDNGVGFNMQYVDKLFGVFQRLHGTDEFEGTGVGLAIVQRVIHRHGGRVWAEGKIGEGATFYFAMPTLSADEGTDRLPR